MEEDKTGWTPFEQDNLLGLTNKDVINEHEAKGIAAAELHVFQLDTELLFQPALFLRYINSLQCSL